MSKKTPTSQLQNSQQTSQPSDMTQAPNLLAHAHGTGALRRRRPVYSDSLPPCNYACPAGENVQAWLGLAQVGKFQEAWETIMKDNPLPAVHGRVCYHPCENSCNRTAVDTSVSIHAVERFLGDLASERGWRVPIEAKPSGKKVLVVGAGPSGLSAGYHLTRLGHHVEIYEAGPIAGGMMNFGIPAYRLPRAELMKEVRRIEDTGVKIHLNRKVENLLEDMKSGGFAAVFVAVGAHLIQKIDLIPGDAAKVYDAVGFLRQAASGDAPKIGRRVAIYGGGNTAMDAARTAQRLGAEETMIIYRRTRDHMPAHTFEVDEALQEGVKINWLRTIKDIEPGKITVEVMTLDGDGRPVPTGEVETIEADSLIMAVGQNTDTAFLKKVPGIEFKADGTVIVSPMMMTGAQGVFAGGDMVPSERTVTVAVGHGKRAARCIDAFLKGEKWQPEPKKEVIAYEKLNLWYFTDAEQKKQVQLDPAQRLRDFTEVVAGLSENEAVFEAKRCFSCGNCFECDGCFGACPEQAIVKLGKGNRYRFDYDKCTGCAVCEEQCPCHAIEMKPEGEGQ